jgi:hypothetical protein
LGIILIALGEAMGILGILTIGLGVLVVVYGFSPETAEKIIDGVVEIATAPFKR